MSSRMHSTVKWESSDEEDSTSDTRFRMKLRESLKSHTQPVESSTAETEVVEPRRRGRGPSKRPCLNRNALMARENRQRKKAYLEKIENKLSFYQEENKTLANTIRKQGIDIKRLSGEVAYLKSVLNNNTSIAALLKTINEGLRKIGASRSKNSFRSSDDISHIYPDSSNVQTDYRRSAKSPRTASPKENGIKAQNENTHACIDSSGDDFADYRSVCNSLDNAAFFLKRDLDKKEESSLGTTASSLSQESDDSYMDNIKDLNSLLPISNLTSIDEKKEGDVMSTDFDQLPPFDMDTFEDLPKCDDMSPIFGLHDSSNLFVEEEMFPNLDNTGICLHVNSDKVSLEYCSLCYANSKSLALN